MSRRVIIYVSRTETGHEPGEKVKGAAGLVFGRRYADCTKQDESDAERIFTGLTSAPAASSGGSGHCIFHLRTTTLPS